MSKNVTKIGQINSNSPKKNNLLILAQGIYEVGYFILHYVNHIIRITQIILIILVKCKSAPYQLN